MRIRRGPFVGPVRLETGLVADAVSVRKHALGAVRLGPAAARAAGLEPAPARGGVPVRPADRRHGTALGPARSPSTPSHLDPESTDRILGSCALGRPDHPW